MGDYLSPGGGDGARDQARGVPLDALVREVLIERQATPVPARSVFEQGLGLFGSPEDAALLDDVVATAYEERRHPERSPDGL